jgi:hypothetical protein
MIRYWPGFLCLALAAAAPLAAQTPDVRLGAGIGPLDFDGRGRTLIIGARLEVPVSPSVFVDAGVAWFSYDSPTSPADTLPGYLLPDVGLAFQVPLGRLHPYLGAGVGLAANLRVGGDGFLALHTAAGLQVDLWDGWGARLDYRVRSLASPHSDSREITIGLTKRLRLPWFGPH